MSSELGDILPMLEPPAGGRDRLLARVRAERSTAPRWAAVAVAAALLLTFLARERGTGGREPVAGHDPVMLALADEAAPLRVIGDNAAAGEVPLGRDDVVYYRVVTASP